MTRQAILIGNSIDYGGLKAFNVPRRVVRHTVDSLAQGLASAQPEPYRVTKVIDEESSNAQQIIKRTLRNAGSDAFVLFFYFGHGILGRDRRLYFYFKDDDVGDLPSMLAFSTVVDWVNSYNVGSTLFVVDCCYAGLGGASILAPTTRPCYLMASVNAKERAAIDYAGEVPIGVFTNWFLHGFSDPRARVPLHRRVTPQSLFDFMKERMRGKSSQEPFCTDHGLAGETLWEQATTVSVQDSLRDSAPKKGLYRKLYAIGSTLLQNPFESERALHQFFERQQTTEMLTPVLVERGVVEYRTIGFRAFQGYVRTARDLGIVEEGTPVRLTSQGRRMCSNDGAKFNALLFDALGRVWKDRGIEIGELEDALSNILRRGGVPSEDAAFGQSFLTKRLRLSRRAFCTLLALSADVGVVQCSRDKTYFPAMAANALLMETPERELT